MNSSFAFFGFIALFLLALAGFLAKAPARRRYLYLALANLLLAVAIIKDPWWSLASGAWRDLIGIAFIDALIIRSINKKAA